MKRSFKQLFLLSCVFSIPVCFNACADPGFHAWDLNAASSSSLAPGAIPPPGGPPGGVSCEEIVKTTYLATYFPLLSDTQNCKRCHSASQGSSDPETSFSAFVARGKTLIDYQSTHSHGGSNLNLSTQIASLQPRWDAGQSEYRACIDAASTRPPSGGTPPPPGAGSMLLASKAIANVAQSLAVPGTWLDVTWDLDIEVPEANRNTLHGIFFVQARYALYSGGVVGFEFRNPALRLKPGSSGSITLISPRLVIDGQSQPGVTTYLGLRATATSVASVELAPRASNALAVYAGASNLSQIAFTFDSAF